MSDTSIFTLIAIIVVAGGFVTLLNQNPETDLYELSDNISENVKESYDYNNSSTNKNDKVAKVFSELGEGFSLTVTYSASWVANKSYDIGWRPSKFKFIAFTLLGLVFFNYTIGLFIFIVCTLIIFGIFVHKKFRGDREDE